MLSDILLTLANNATKGSSHFPPCLDQLGLANLSKAAIPDDLGVGVRDLGGPVVRMLFQPGRFATR